MSNIKHNYFYEYGFLEIMPIKSNSNDLKHVALYCKVSACMHAFMLAILDNYRVIRNW